MRGLVRLAGDGSKELGVVARVALLATALRPAVVGGVHARLAAQRVDADAGVVRERRQARRAARVPRLGQGVLEKGEVRLLGIRDAELALGNDLDLKGRQQRADLGKLAGIAARHNELPHG